MPRDFERPNENEEEPQGINEVKVGGGDPVNILRMVEEVERNIGGVGQTVSVELSQKEIKQIIGDITNLPFHVGNPSGTRVFDSIGEIPDYARSVHEAEVILSPFALRMPKDQKEYSVTFLFKNSDIWATGLCPHSAKDLEISQPMWSSAHNMNWSQKEKDELQVRIGFSPEKKCKIGNKKIAMINLLVRR